MELLTFGNILACAGAAASGPGAEPGEDGRARTGPAPVLAPDYAMYDEDEEESDEDFLDDEGLGDDDFEEGDEDFLEDDEEELEEGEGFAEEDDDEDDEL